MYKIKLSEIQINNIYIITDNKDKQSRIMSILSYLMKYTDAETMQLMKSLNKLYNMYLRYHKYISRSYFYEISNLILENNYFLYKPENKKVKTLSDIINSAETIENANLKNDSEKPNNLTNANTNTYTLNTTSVVNAIDLIEDVFKDLKVKSKVIKSMVIAKLQNTALDAAGAVAYIVKVITEKTEQYNNMRINYAKAVANTKYSKSKNIYTNKSKTLKFNDIDSRDYDYDSLEKKLLGWK